MSNAIATRAGLEELLRFYAEAGVDEPLDDAPVDRFARSVKPAAAPPVAETRPEPYRPALPAAEPRAPAPAATVPDEAQAARAREMARTAGSLEELREILSRFDGCNLKFTAKSLVFADGNPNAPIMFVGEAPGREEDLEGLPFVGRSGQLLDRILAAIGLDRTSAYIANVIPWRPPGNRDPSPMETEICRPFIERQIELVGPKVLVTLGNASSKALLKTQTGIMRLRGSWQPYQTSDGREIPLMPTLHPAYLLRNPAHKKLVWRDFLDIKAKLRSLTAQD
jgi:uracil-DNA glycosylase family 4